MIVSKFRSKYNSIKVYNRFYNLMSLAKPYTVTAIEGHVKKWSIVTIRGNYVTILLNQNFDRVKRS